MKKTARVLTLSLMAIGFYFPAWGFDKPLADKTHGIQFPHILQTETFTINARNVKTLTVQGNILWVGTSMGIIRYDLNADSEYEVFDNRNGLLSSGIFTIKSGPGHEIWVGTYGGGLSRYDGKQWVNLNTPDGLNDAFVYDIEFAADRIWIATWSGANSIRGNPADRTSWDSFTVENTNGGLIDNWVYAVEIGENNRIWFGTEAGISMFDGSRWKAWNHRDGLGAALGLVRQDNAGVVSDLQGTHHSAHSPGIPNTTSQTYRPNYVVSMLLDQSGRLWTGTWGAGLSMLDTHTLTFRTFTTKDGLPGNYILALEEGPDGNLWIGSNGGLSRFDGAVFTNYSKINALVSNFVFSIAFGDHQSLWVGGHFGLNELKMNPETGKLLRVE